MSDRMWKVTIKHAMTCDMGSKIYRYRGPQFTILLNPICKLIKANINGQEFSSREYLSQMNKVQYINHLLMTHICSITLLCGLHYMLDIGPLIHFNWCYTISKFVELYR
jgi:hypothetical protein